MATAIELYRKAYDLDYRKGDWQQAEELYKEIAEKFPYSDEKEYALVHLERIEKLRANPLDQRLQPVRATGGSGAFSAVNFVLILIVSVGVGLNGWFWWQSHQKLAYQDMLIAAMLNEKIENLKTAEDLLKQAQVQLPREPLAYRFLAELYLERNLFKLADIEASKWQVADPGDKAVGEFRMRLKSAQDSAGMR